MAAFSEPIRAQADALKKFLLDNLYRHYQVLRMMSKARRIVRDLFTAFLERPELLAREYRRDDPVEQARAIADYRSEEHTSELQSLMRISYAVFCLKKQKKTTNK